MIIVHIQTSIKPVLFPAENKSIRKGIISLQNTHNFILTFCCLYKISKDKRTGGLRHQRYNEWSKCNI